MTVKRWRADIGESYYCLADTSSGVRIVEVKDVRSRLDNNRYELGNYFKDKNPPIYLHAYPILQLLKEGYDVYAFNER